MTWFLTLTVILALLGLLVLDLKRRLDALPNKQKKALLKKKVNGVFTWCEDKGLLARTPAFDRDYLKQYPALRRLEEGYDAVREECLELLNIKDKLTDMSAMGGSYTQAGIHTAKWKTFMFKSGEFIAENCALCPRTAALLQGIPHMYTAFFSVLDPHQYVTPHWGYYKGFLRYHLGVVIPGDNVDGSCTLRVNGNAEDNERRDIALIENAETYFWKNGQGIVFDDNYLHDARNGSDQIRVVLWVDLRRKMPWFLRLFHSLCLAMVYRDKSVQKIRENAVVVP